MVNAVQTHRDCSVSTAILSISRVVPIIAAAISRIPLSGAVERLERRGVDQREIIDPQEAGVDQRLLGGCEAPRRPLRRRGSRLAPFRAPAASATARAARRPTGTGCATTAPARPCRAPSPLRRSRRRGRGRRPCGGSPRAAENPFRQTAATSGRTDSNSLATTVATPSKWPGRASPSQRSDTPETWILVAKPCG